MASTARLDELKKKFDENPRRYFAPLANEHRKSGDLDQAISLCRAHLPQQPAHISGHIVLAQALFEAGSVDESRDIFLAALGLDPENLIALRYLGDIAREANDVETARTWYQRVLEVDPRNDEIVQMVRDLDAPRAVAAEPLVVAEPEAAAPVVPPPTPVNAAAEDPRHAPLSMDGFDVDGEPSHAEADAAPTNETTVPPPDEGAFEVHAEWSTASPSVELPMLDTEEIDPFDLHPSASAESLFDAAPDSASEEFFLTELSSGVNAPEDIGEPAQAYADTTWQATPAEDPAAAASPSAETGETGEAGAATFEEGAFYLEEAPTALDSTDEPVTAQVAGAEDTAADVSHSVAQAPSHNADIDSQADADHNAEAMALFADNDTAEWQPPADALLGRSPELTTAEQASTPAAFVTETMAELYLQQGFRNEALAVYRELLARNPADASLRERVEQIENGSMSSIGMATLSENVVDSAIKRQAGRSSRTVRSFFASLAGRRAPLAGAGPHDAADASGTSPEADYAAPNGTSEPVPISELATPPASPASSELLAEIVWPTEPQRVPPISAAETLATFDPFADTMEMPTEPSAAPDYATPNVTPAQASGALPEIDYVAEAFAPPAERASAEGESMPARRSLEDLFPDTPVTPRSEAAAQAFATAFGRDEPQGRPTRAASNELSLDHVFRGAPEGAPPADGGFSFDQFFSDSRPAGGSDVAATPTISASPHGRGGPPNDAHDIEQFTAWLEGLKKK